MITERGNIALKDRPIVHNPDRTVSTINSISINEDGMEVLIPTIVNGRQVSDDEAIEHYYQTGEHLGKFPNSQTADLYAQILHNIEEKRTMPLTDKTNFNSEVPDRTRIQMTKPFQTSNSGLSNPKTPNNPNAQLPSARSSYNTADNSVYPDALTTTRRQMAKDAIDTMSDEQLSEILSLAAGERRFNPPLIQRMIDESKPPVTFGDNATTFEFTQQNRPYNAVPNTTVEERGPMAQQSIPLEEWYKLHPFSSGEADDVAVQPSYPSPRAVQPSRTLNIPWLNEGNSR